MISILVAIILSIVLTGIAFAIAETLAKLFHISHPKNMFSIYFDLGFEHITDLNGYDHILFLIALSAVYLLKDWKNKKY